MENHDLAATIEDFDRCVRVRDRESAEQFLHADYELVFVQPARAVVSREHWLDVLPSYLIHVYDVEERITDISGDTAAVLQRIRMQTTVLGQDRSGAFVVSDIWLRGDAGWRIWRRHSTPLSAGALPGT